MQFYNYLKMKLPFFVALGFSFVLASCGSYQYVGYESDGIYSNNEVTYEELSNTETETSTTNEDNSYYKAYFSEKANQYSEIPDDEKVVFTDIDSYEGEYSEENQAGDSQNGYAGWGQANSNVTINYIDNSWGYSPWGWNAGYGWGWNNWGWYRPWGWNNWNIGYGWGWNNWGWNTGWRYNYWCPPGFNGYYYNRGLAYHNGYRGSNLAYGRNRNSIISRRNTSNLSRRNTSIISNRGTRTRARTNSRTTIRRNNNSTIRRNSTRSRSNSTVRPRTNTRSRNNATRSRSSGNRSSSRMTTTPRRNSSSMRSSRSSSRSSGTSSRSSSRGSSSRRR